MLDLFACGWAGGFACNFAMHRTLLLPFGEPPKNHRRLKLETSKYHITRFSAKMRFGNEGSSAQERE